MKQARLVGLGGTLAILGPAFAVIAYVAALPSLISELRLAGRRMNLLEVLSQPERRRAFYGELMSDPRAVKETRLFGSGATCSAG
ncbi:hypothetical protein Ais01nite_74380 [Asanoa ishikariensis]|uniref:Uncharacterized protein n=1 Tax=Asanoa ishikariensis TaxID=137265 RepID=A0A1H3US50_9ACTN|nr:hypothetical protein [Asanoa ishikariensis]GIF69403.1 hypothetical protein Ais01nite_74380 [Asanoa ishikariensis]SDZ65214.1 hypothetical protein SAMN05421684_7962 [Asanoa ishikariensis]